MDDRFEPDPTKKFDIVGVSRKEKYPNIGELVVSTIWSSRLEEPSGPGIVVGYDYDYEYGVPIFLVQWPDFLLWEEYTNIRKLEEKF